jgi:branched-chain amino acid transport system permease protein
LRTVFARLDCRDRPQSALDSAHADTGSDPHVTLFLQQTINGVALGSVYALVALGLTLVYGVLHIPNFSHGALYMVGAYVTYFAVMSYGVPYLPAIAISVIVLAGLGALMERVAFRPITGRSPVNAMIVGLGLLLFLEGAAHALWGADYRRLDTPFDGVINLVGLTITEQRLMVIVAAVLVMLGLYYFLKRTVMGMTIEAMAQDREGALLVGIDTRRVALITFALSAALAAVAASLVAPLVLVFPAMGEVLNLKAFVIIILGGMGSVPGAIIGGYVLALAEVYGGTYISFAFADLAGFAILVLVLAIRPEGLFAKGA